MAKYTGESRTLRTPGRCDEYKILLSGQWQRRPAGLLIEVRRPFSNDAHPRRH